MTAMKADLGAHYLETVVADFERAKRLAERALAQLDDRDLHFRFGPNTNSISTIARHVSGNLKSRWTDLFAADGEKPSRDRDAEFLDDARSKSEILADWEEGWKCLFAAVESLKPSDLLRTVTIRNEPHTVVEATNRAWGHVNHHVGQMLFLARHTKGDSWQWLPIAPGQSKSYAPPPENARISPPAAGFEARCTRVIRA